MHIHIINGPNLNLLGKREPDIYGKETFDGFLERLIGLFPNWQITYFQSNVEGEIINSLHDYGFKADGIILNAGGFTHTSVAIGDAVAAIKSPVIEVHISNVHARESFRHQSFIAPHAKGVISGFGLDSYRLALHFFDLQKL
ncbi:MAG: type II 3-dehydroquinate dehydratase [Flavobacteriales bacterium]